MSGEQRLPQWYLDELAAKYGESIFRCPDGRECKHPNHPQSLRHGEPMPEPTFGSYHNPEPRPLADLHGLPPDAMKTESWWVIEASALRKLMERAQAGEDISQVMLEEYVNSHSWRPGEDNES